MNTIKNIFKSMCKRIVKYIKETFPDNEDDWLDRQN
jgi:hypothetical protein